MKENVITSRQNPKVKAAKQLLQKKYRKETALFLVEGIRHVGAAVEAGAVIKEIFFAPDLLTSEYAYRMIEIANGKKIDCIPVAGSILESLSGKSGPQGIMAVVKQNTTPVSSLDPENFSWGAAVVGAQDPGNIGTLLRTVDAVGADGLILIDTGADPWHPTSVRASMGTIFLVPIVQTTFAEFAKWALDKGYLVIGTSAKASEDYLSVEYKQPSILLLGSEREGLSSDQSSICQKMVSLPMAGHASSLNLSVAAGVLLYAMRSAIEEKLK